LTSSTAWGRYREGRVAQAERGRLRARRLDALRREVDPGEAAAREGAGEQVDGVPLPAADVEHVDAGVEPLCQPGGQRDDPPEQARVVERPVLLSLEPLEVGEPAVSHPPPERNASTTPSSTRPISPM